MPVNDTYAFANAEWTMAFEDSPAVRAKVRDALRAYMAGPPPRGPYAVESDIRKNQAILGGTVSHETIVRCRDGDERKRRPSRLRTLYHFLVFRRQIFDPDVQFPEIVADPVYQMLEHFFGVRLHNRALCSLLDGNYSLFFRSEDISQSIVVGAVAFSRNKETQAFEVTELQQSERPRRVERWNGHYFARQERIVIVERGKGQILRDTPKFYVLNTPHADETDNGQVVTEVGGTMLKFGSGGTNTGAFSAKVLLRRDPEAFDKCNVVPIETVDPDILNEI